MRGRQSLQSPAQRDAGAPPALDAAGRDPPAARRRSPTILKHRTFLPLAALLSAATFVVPGLARGDWPANGRALCTYDGVQNYPVIAPDGTGGAIAAWEDRRSGASDVYAMRVGANGNLIGGWPAGGLAVCTAAQSQVAPVIVPDGSGGAFIAWEDYRAGGANPDIYVQRVTQSGAIASGWPANGVAVCALSSVQGRPSVIRDGTGGVIVAWEDFRNGASDVYTQRLNGAGTAQWLANGIALCTASGHQRFPIAVSDGTGGAIVVWEDGRGDGDVYAGRISATGIVSWAADGVAVSAADGEQLAIRAASDGQGGVVVAWEDYRDLNTDVYAQRLTGDGTAQWTANGVALCTHLDEQYGVAIAGDGGGGAFVAWVDLRAGETDIFGHHVDATGSPAPGWPFDGLAVCAAAGNQTDAVVTGDGGGGAFFAWNDTRPGTALSDVYALRLNGDGTPPNGWSPDGAPYCAASGNQSVYALQPDGAGGAIAAWSDQRGATLDIYALRIAGTGEPPTVDVGASGPFPGPGLAAAPNPMIRDTELRFALDTEATVGAAIVDVSGRRMRVLLEGARMPAGAHRVVWDGRDQSGRRVPAGVYLALLTAGDRTRAARLVVVP